MFYSQIGWLSDYKVDSEKSWGAQLISNLLNSYRLYIQTVFCPEVISIVIKPITKVGDHGY